MLLYILLFACTLFWYLISKDNNTRNVRGLLIFSFSLAILVGCSDMFGGYDRYIYGEVFDRLADDIEKGWSYKDSIIMD